MRGRPVGTLEAGSTTSRILDLLDAHPGEWFTAHGLHAEYVDRWGATEYETVRRALYRVIDRPPTWGKVYVRRLPRDGRGSRWSTEVLWEYQEATG